MLLFLSAVMLIYADVHVKLEKRRLYLDFERVQVSEFWFTEGKSYSREGRRLIIVRKDLGVRWVVDLIRKFYVEVPLDEDRIPAEIEEQSLQTAGFYYDPRFEWEVRDTGESEDKYGYACRIHETRGEADYAFVESRYWICQEGEFREGAEFREFMIDRLLEEYESESLRAILIEQPSGFPVYWEESHNGAIAPVIFNRTSLVHMETEHAPTGIYELPEGVIRRR